MKFALIQLENSHDIENNIKLIMAYMDDHPEVDYFMTPESTITGYSSDKVRSMTLEDPRLLKLLNYCSNKNKHLFVGCNILDQDDYIAYLYIHKDIKAYYKSHLGLKEKQVFKPGDELAVFDTGKVKVGIAICIESHIPDIAQTLALRGADIILMPFASSSICGKRKDMWLKYLPARAYDNSVFVLAANQTGGKFTGGLMVFDYKGHVLISHHDEEPCTKIIDLDIKARRERVKKEKTNYLKRRRPNLYGKEY